MKKFGIDISRHQGNFNFDMAINEGVEFAIIKGGGGDKGLYVDPKFTRNYTEAKKRKLPIGVYWFSKALSVSDAKREAEYFYENCLKGRQFELPVYFDVEKTEQAKLGKKTLTDITIAWLDTIQSKGYWVGIYTYKSYLISYLDDTRLQKYAHWIAEWNTKCTYKGNEGVLGMWQFGGETNRIRTNKIAGVVCDQDYMLIDYETMIKSAGLNGFGKTSQPKYIQYTIKKGDTLSTIAKRYNTTSKELVNLNGIKNPDKIYAGNVIKIPR